MSRRTRSLVVAAVVVVLLAAGALVAVLVAGDRSNRGDQPTAWQLLHARYAQIALDIEAGIPCDCNRTATR